MTLDGRVVYIQITDAGKALIDKYVDEYFTSLSKELTDITDEEANVMIEVVEKFYAVMSERNV